MMQTEGGSLSTSQQHMFSPNKCPLKYNLALADKRLERGHVLCKPQQVGPFSRLGPLSCARALQLPHPAQWS